jgi:hypothetical protein
VSVSSRFSALLGICALLSIACGSTAPAPPAAPRATPKPREAREQKEPEAARPMLRPAPAPPVLAKGKPIIRVSRERSGIALYVPATIALREERFDLVVHFHGPLDTTVASMEQSDLRAAVVNVDLGPGAPLYKAAFTPPESLRSVIDFAERNLAESGRVKKGMIGRVALSSWSAGYGAVREIMKRPEDMARVEAVLLADGFFSEWSDPRRHTVSVDKLDDSFNFAYRASRGARLFVVTHTSLDTGVYAGPADCAVALIHELGGKLGPPHVPNVDAGGPPAYAVDMGELHVWGFGGTSWDDHLAQHRAMGALHYAALKSFWERM